MFRLLLLVVFVASGCDESGVPSVPLEAMWTVPHAPAGGPEVTPLIVGDTLVVASAGTDLVAVRLATGEVVWRTPTDPDYALLSYSLLTDGERVYTSQSTARSPEFRAYDLATGTPVWTRSADGTDGIATVSPYALYAVGQGSFFAATHLGEIIAFDGATGATRWTVALDSISADALTYDDGVLYAGRGRVNGGAVGAVSAFDAASGRELWTHVHTAPAWAARPIIHGDEVLALSDSLLRLDRATGRLLDTQPLDGASASMTPALDTEAAYGADNAPWRLDLASGHVRWRADFQGGGGYNTAVVGGRVYWARGSVIVLDAETGRHLHSETAPGGYVLRVAAAGDLLIAQTGGGLTAYRPGLIPSLP